MKEMCIKLPRWSCPICGGRRFIISEYKATNYLLDNDGVVKEYKDKYYGAGGMCLKCNTVFEMMPTSTGFIPLTRLRKIFFEYSPISELLNESEYDYEPNPMEKCHES